MWNFNYRNGREVNSLRFADDIIVLCEKLEGEMKELVECDTRQNGKPSLRVNKDTTNIISN